MAFRPEHLGRLVAAALALWLVVAPAPSRAEGRAFLVPVGDNLREPAERQDLMPLLGSLGFREISWVDVADIERHIGLISITDMRADESCGGSVPLADWGARLGQAQEQVQLLAPEKALVALSALSLDMACLERVPRRGELVLLHLVSAEAHTMAAATTQDVGVRLYHQGEVEHALAMAAGFGPDLPPPTWLAPELSQRLLDLQQDFTTGAQVPLFIGGSPKGLFLDGARISTGFRRVTPGQHLVQATWGEDVVAARLIHVLPGRRTVLRVTPGEPALEPEELVVQLQRLAAGAEPHPLLVDLLGLLAQDADDALIVTLGAEGPMIWGRGRGGVVLRYPNGDLAPRALGFEDVGGEPAPAERTRPDPLPWTLGAGPVLQWTNLGGAPIEGLGGLCGGLSIQGRLGFARRFAVAAALQPVARVEALPPGYDVSWLWRAIIPVRAGLRVGAPVPAAHLEGGLDAGLLYLGRFRSHEARAMGVASVGLFLPLSPRFGLRFELWGGLGSGFQAGGLQLTGETHPAPPPMESP